MGDDAIVEASLRRMGAMEGSADEALVYDLRDRYGEDYVKDLTVALYYDGVARRAEIIGVDYKVRIPGINLVIDQLRRGLNQPHPGRPELAPLGARMKSSSEGTRNGKAILPGQHRVH
jgi:hypothetical protein